MIPEPDSKSPDARLGRFEKMQAPAMHHAVVSRAPALLLTLLGAILLALQPCHAATEAAAPGFRAIKPNSGAQPDPPLWAQRQPFGPASHPAHLDYTTFTRVSPQYRIYHNLWYHNQRWYAMLPPEQVSDKTVEEGLSANQPIVRMPIKDMHNFTKQLRVRPRGCLQGLQCRRGQQRPQHLLSYPQAHHLVQPTGRAALQPSVSHMALALHPTCG